MAMSAVQMGLAIYMGYFIPKEYHHFFAFSARDFFLIAFVGFALGLYGVLKENK
jgi:uncharacterized membrane protein YjjP (DUF1212 family)